MSGSIFVKFMGKFAVLMVNVLLKLCEGPSFIDTETQLIGEFTFTYLVMNAF